MKRKNKIKILFLSLTLISILSISINAQESDKNDLSINNETVIELVKSGLSEKIIIAKIKSSKTNFDTSTESLVKLKEEGITDNLVLAMIESKSKRDAEIENADVETENIILGDMKNAVGKRIVYIDSIDDEVKIEIAKKLTKKGFSIVNDKSEAELLVELTYAESETQTKTGIFRSGSDTKYLSKIGKLTVKVIQPTQISLVYSHEYPYAKAANFGALLGASVAPPSLRDQVKSYLVDDFLKKLKKAGDKFK